MDFKVVRVDRGGDKQAVSRFGVQSYVRIMEKQMEATIVGLGLRLWDWVMRIFSQFWGPLLKQGF